VPVAQPQEAALKGVVLALNGVLQEVLRLCVWGDCVCVESEKLQQSALGVLFFYLTIPTLPSLEDAAS